jgi:hypothetical protein
MCGNTFIRAEYSTKIRKDVLKRAGRTVLHYLHHPVPNLRQHIMDRNTVSLREE